jgi:hypothetical protein
MRDVDRIWIRKVYACCPGWPSEGVIIALQSDINIWYPSLPSAPHNKWRSTWPGRSWYLLSITGLAALDGQYHSLSGIYFSASSRVTFLLPATQAERHAGSTVYIWNVFGKNLHISAGAWPGSSSSAGVPPLRSASARKTKWRHAGNSTTCIFLRVMINIERPLS